MLTVEHARKSYRKGKHVLRGVNLTVEEGEIVGLVGESGSGKSTLARLIMQLEPPDAGAVLFRGAPVGKSDRRSFYQQCQLIYQNAAAAMNPAWTVAEILTEPVRKRADRDAYIRHMLGKVKLTEAHLKRRPAELSGGEKQRVNLLRSLLLQPQLLVCDEIVSNLDRLVQKEVIDLLLELNRETGMAVLFISHDLRAVTYLCSRIYVMKDGEIVDELVETEEGFTATHPYSEKLFAGIGRMKGESS